MPKLLKNGALIEDDWTEIGAEEPLPQGPVIIPVARLQEITHAPLGIRVPNNFDVETLKPALSRLALIVLDFPKFVDGRAYSQACKLREMGFTGELRATGDVLPDQLLFMHRCGFDAFVLAKGDPVLAWTRAMSFFSGFYQLASDPSVPAFARRSTFAKATADKSTFAKATVGKR